MTQNSSIPLKTKTKIELKKRKVDLEARLSREITWDEFFNIININFSGEQ